MNKVGTKKAKEEVLVVVHDAGASEIIAAYIKKHADRKDFRSYAAGPGAKIFRREDITFHTITNDSKKIAHVLGKHRNVSFVLLGTGWMTKIESTALGEAKKLHVKTAVYLESWSNYRERFGYPNVGWQKHLPDEIWVGDRSAEMMAKKYFPRTKVRFVANTYFSNIKKRFKKLKQTSKQKSRVGANEILFLSDAVPGMEAIFEELLMQLARLEVHINIRIRFHPADDRTRYDKTIQHFNGIFMVKKSNEKDIVRDLLYVKAVIGTETVAMVGGVLCGIKTISISNLGKKKAPIPFQQLIWVKNAKAAANLI